MRCQSHRRGGVAVVGSASIFNSVGFAAITPATGPIRGTIGVETGRKKPSGGKARTATFPAVLRVLLGRGRSTDFHSEKKLIDHVRRFAVVDVHKF